MPRKTEAVEDVDLDVEDNPADAGLLLSTTNPTTTKKALDFKGFVGASRPMAMQAGMGVLGFLGGNWFRENVSLRAVNTVFKSATPGQGLVLDTLIQLFVAWQLARRTKTLGKAVAFGILVNQALAVGKHFMKDKASRFDVVVFQNGGGAPAPANGNGNGTPATSGIMPSRRMGGIMPAQRTAA